MTRIPMLALAAALTPSAAFAHIILIETEAAADRSFKAVLAVGHGCDGRATIELRVRLPEGFVGAKPMPKPGWTVDIVEAPFGASYDLHGEAVARGPVEIRWSGGSLEDAWYDEFTVRGTFAGFPAERTVAFPVTQVCTGGVSVAWDETAPAGAHPHSLAHPAPVVTVRPQALVGGHAGHATGAARSVAAAASGPAEHGAQASATIAVSGGFARAMLPGAAVGGGYLTIANTGAGDDRLVRVASPSARAVELHQMAMQGDVMTMRTMPDGLAVPAGATVELKPGGAHLMFTGLAAPFREGDSVPLVLTFETAGDVEAVLAVGPAAAKGPAGHAH